MSEAAQVGFKPLYTQVHAEIVRRLADGDWQPGTMLPSEQQIARSLGVSQGTVRKALDALTAERILVRKQGRGTFVAEFEDSRILFKFFRLIPDSGERLFPQSRVIKRTSHAANEAERSSLNLKSGEKVWRIERVRHFDADVILIETISLSVKRFPDFGDLSEIPNNVYQLYSQRYGVAVARSSEKIKAVAASRHDAEHLGCAKATPLLSVVRTAYDIADNPVELRHSRCLTTKIHYSADL